jgi:hypothetical protein
LSLLTADAVGDGALAALDDDFEQGRYTVTDMLWGATPKRAGDLNTRQIGGRSLDILHVTSALELKCRSFLTFDVRQQQSSSYWHRSAHCHVPWMSATTLSASAVIVESVQRREEIGRQSSF